MTEKDISKIKTTIVTYEEFSDYLFNPPATYYVMDSLQNYLFVHTASRVEAQKVIDSIYGEKKYSVVASKLQKTKCKNEAGTYTCTGVGTRKR